MFHWMPHSLTIPFPPHPTIPVANGGFALLGSPIGPSFHGESSVLKQVEKVQGVLDRLSDLEDSQMETTLIRFCLGLPKIAFTLQTCPPSLIQRALMAFNDSLRDILSDLAGGPLSDWAWLKASLPSSLGGMAGNVSRSSSLHWLITSVKVFHIRYSQVPPMCSPTSSPLHLCFSRSCSQTQVVLSS